MKKQLTIGTIALSLLLTGCTVSGGSTDTPTTETSKPATASVEWEDYAPTLQSDIDALTAAKDCNALQEQFNNADSNNTATQERTGHNNAKLMRYLDEAMKTASCY